jgi:hypothetical protein
MDLLAALQSSGMAVPIGIGIALLFLTSGHSNRSEERQSSNAGGLLWCAFVLVAVVGSAWLFDFPHGAGMGVGFQPPFDPFGLRGH